MLFAELRSGGTREKSPPWQGYSGGKGLFEGLAFGRVAPHKKAEELHGPDGRYWIQTKTTAFRAMRSPRPVSSKAGLQRSTSVRVTFYLSRGIVSGAVMNLASHPIERVAQMIAGRVSRLLPVSCPGDAKRKPYSVSCALIKNTSIVRATSHGVSAALIV